MAWQDAPSDETWDVAQRAVEDQDHDAADGEAEAAWDEQDEAEAEADVALEQEADWDAGSRVPLIRPGEDLVAGRRPVEEAFAARREAHRLLVVPERRAALEALVLHATTLRIPVSELEGGTMTSLAGFDGHQGVALVVAERRWATLDEIVARARTRGEAPLVLVLDSLEDPQNVGTLLRSAEASGVHGVLFPTRRAAPMTASVIKASAGASEHLLLAPVDDLPGALVDLHARGLRIVGSDETAPLAYRDADLRGPLAIIVGSEGRGVSAAVRRRLDLVVRIPMRGRVASLNAAVAGSVLLFEASAQRPAPAPVASPVEETTTPARSAEPDGEDDATPTESSADSKAASGVDTAPAAEAPPRRTRRATASAKAPSTAEVAKKPTQRAKASAEARPAPEDPPEATQRTRAPKVKGEVPKAVEASPKPARRTRPSKPAVEAPNAAETPAPAPRPARRTRASKPAAGSSTSTEPSVTEGPAADELLPGEVAARKPRRKSHTA